MFNVHSFTQVFSEHLLHGRHCPGTRSGGEMSLLWGTCLLVRTEEPQSRDMNDPSVNPVPGRNMRASGELAV